MFTQQQKQQESLSSSVMRRSPTTVSSISSWHPINASPSDDMWELPASSSSMSDDGEDFYTSGLHQEFSIYSDNHDGSINTNNREQDNLTPMPRTVSVRTTRQHGYYNRRDTSSRMSNGTNRSRNRGIGLSEDKCVLGDATNTLRRKNNLR
mmetsp:Transcript_12498/g.28851  ORF Transcript_12498/g.28851 Transcript_12498/m.28851 type:complete len:151 (-) Transcript_12498:321-773(-)